MTAIASGSGKSLRYLVGTAEGLVIPTKITFATKFESGSRTIRPSIVASTPIKVSDESIRSLAFRWGDAGVGMAALTESGRLVFVRLNQEEITEAQESAARPVPLGPTELPLPPGRVTAMALDTPLVNLYVGTNDGRVHHISLGVPDRPELVGSYATEGAPAPITKLGLLLGDRSLVVMTGAGRVSTWIQVRTPEQPDRWLLRQNHVLPSHSSAVTAFAPSQRDKGFVTGDASGNVFVQYATSEQTVLRLQGDGTPLRAVAFAPKANGVLAYDQNGQLRVYALHNPHPEVTWKTLFLPVWYEGYDRPAHVWQSSSGSDDFEAKLGLAPLAFGTLKGTLYALLFAIPIAILGAIFTSQFMHPNLRAKIKPIIEVMAALPTVVLGFLAGLWMAPLLDRIFPALVGMTVAIPVIVVAASFVWRFAPGGFRHRFRSGTEALLLLPLIVAGMVACLWANAGIEQLLFGGNFKEWLSYAYGLRYDQRNAVVVGIVMGFAIIPIIYSISEEALSNVPKNLIAGSLALGATRWQTVTQMVLLAASPGIFSAIMIGFGRAIGETMIVLMATGNTPIMDWNWFNGFRTLSANIAVEIPEAPHGGTLYRTLFLAALLLFGLTFTINTAAELVRQRLRRKHGTL